MEELTDKEKQAVSTGIVIDREKLSQVSEPISKIDDKELFKLIDRMERIMIANRGIGLAHVQVEPNNPKQIFVMLNPEERIETVINPEIVKSYWQTECIPEGCLSLPDEKYYNVCRPKKITVKYMTIRNKELEEVETEFRGLFSIIFQHELDHLQGKLYTDYKI